VIIKLFNGKNIALQFAVILLFFFSMINREVIVQSPQGFGPLYDLLYQSIEGSPILIYSIFVGLVVIEGLLIQLIVMMYNLVARNNYIVLLIWLILVFSNPLLASINPVLISTVLITWALFQLLAITENINPLPKIFSVGFVFSTASLIYGNLIWFSLFLITALLILSLFKGRSVLISIISFTTPYIYLFTYGFVMDQEIQFWSQFHFGLGEWNFFQNEVSLGVSIAIGIIVLTLSVISISKVMMRLFSKLIQTRNVTKVLFAWLIASFMLQFLSGNWWYVHPILLFVPITLFIAIFLSELKKTIYFDITLISLIALDLIQLYYKSNA